MVKIALKQMSPFRAFIDNIHMPKNKSFKLARIFMCAVIGGSIDPLVVLTGVGAKHRLSRTKNLTMASGRRLAMPTAFLRNSVEISASVRTRVWF